jgi:hypothetical protein
MLVAGLREADRLEIVAASGKPPEVALPESLAMSTKAWVLLDGGVAVGIWGVAPWPHTPGLGVPWLLATDRFDLHHNRRELLRYTRHYVAAMGEGFDYLVNYTDVRHRASHRWLKWAGFKLDDFRPSFGFEGRPFYRFSKET